MRIDIITLFPELFTSSFSQSIIQRAEEAMKVSIHYHQLRDYASDKHKTVDDTPYGGGAGMVLKVDVVDQAITDVRRLGQAELPNQKPYHVLLTPQGEPYKQHIARQLANTDWLILICGHYEGFDERIRSLVDAEISIGDYILTGGEIPAMVLVDSVVRLLPGVLGKAISHQNESHEQTYLEYPHYTRPEVYNGQPIPAILKSGDHAKIAAWRTEQARLRTIERRPDIRLTSIDNQPPDKV